MLICSNTESLVFIRLTGDELWHLQRQHFSLKISYVEVIKARGGTWKGRAERWGQKVAAVGQHRLWHFCRAKSKTCALNPLDLARGVRDFSRRKTTRWASYFSRAAEQRNKRPGTKNWTEMLGRWAAGRETAGCFVQRRTFEKGCVCSGTALLRFTHRVLCFLCFISTETLTTLPWRFARLPTAFFFFKFRRMGDKE